MEPLEREGGGAGDRLRGLLEAECAADAELLELLWRHRQVAAVVDRAGKPSRDLLADFRRRMRERVAARILERQRAGVLRADADPEVCADVVVGAYEDFSRRMADLREKPDLAGWARTLLVVLYEGILARGTAEPPPLPSARRSSTR